MLPVLDDAYHLRTPEGAKHFCCEGCRGIFKLLNGIDDEASSLPIETMTNRGEQS
jgi:hypothetical protein